MGLKKNLRKHDRINNLTLIQVHEIESNAHDKIEEFFFRSNNKKKL